MILTVAVCALLIEAALGYPERLVRTIGHPVTWIGALVDALDRLLNDPTRSSLVRRAAGIAAVAVLLAVTVGAAWAVTRATLALPFGFVLLATGASSLLAQRSLHAHVARVAESLEKLGLEAGRRAVSHIVGRDPDHLDEAAVCRAAIESLAENFSDGVVAPAFWLAIGGLPGGAAYKAINTADSMIGHRTSRYAAFGWAAARLDDLVNLPASRLSALLLVAAAGLLPDTNAPAAWSVMRRDAGLHRSPNAGWPEAAMAGALDLMLGGPRSYTGVEIADGFVGRGRREATAADIRRALRLYRSADALLIVFAALLAGITLIARG